MNTSISRWRHRWRLFLTAVGAANAVAAQEPRLTDATVVTIQEQPVPVYPATLPAGLTPPCPGTTKEGFEYLVVRTAAGASAIVPVTIENGLLNLRYGAERIG